MADTDYEPCREAEGTELAEHFENAAERCRMKNNLPENTTGLAELERRGAVLRNLLATINAQRDRIHTLRLQLSRWEAPS